MSVDAALNARNDIDFLNRNAFKSDEALQKENQIDGVIGRLAEQLKLHELTPKDFKEIPGRFKESILKKFKEINEASQKDKVDEDTLVPYLDDALAKTLLASHLFDKVINKSYLNYNADLTTLSVHSSHLSEDELKKMLNEIDPKVKSSIAVLDLSNCPLTDLTGLEGFTNVGKFVLTSNTELTSLSGMKEFPSVTVLDVSTCGNLTSLKGVEGLQLKEVNADNSGLEDIDDLYQCVNTLTSLSLNGCSLLNEGYEKVLSQLVNTETLELCHHKKLHDTNFAHDLQSLVHLNLDYSNVANLDGIAHLAKLQAPKCVGCPLPDGEFAKLIKH